MINRRKLLSGIGSVGLSMTLAGCIGEVETSDLSEYDRQGFERYEEGYELAENTIAEIEEEGIIELSPQESPSEGSQYEWVETFKEYNGILSDASNLFTESRVLSESPAFNHSTVNAENWISAYQTTLSGISEFFRWNGFPTEENWNTERPGYDRYSDGIELIDEVEKPMSPPNLLDEVVGEYSIFDRVST